ncbi:hypothetical protein Ocin01_04675 [Orchesella cincta]|uniref:CUB domain-containing protein n=1 Tax=Orchesella cincta TaxID=48709 RepID=A0A1D2N9V4_ORCCI|nr:hypothetical protein Ocin01_04675 [Orchesella cincta]
MKINCVTLLSTFLGVSLAQETATECGQTINSNQGAIEYKWHEPYEANELCVFIIRTQNVTGITITLFDHGISDSDPEAITILGFNETGLVVSTHVGPPEWFPTRSIDATHAVVIFKTNTSLGTGFRMTYIADRFPSETLLADDRVFNNATHNELTLPLETNYIRQPHTNILVMTDEAKLITDPDTALKLTVWENLYGCGDYLMIYKFDETNEASFVARLCGGNSNGDVFQTKGIFIVLFYKLTTGIKMAELNWEKVLTNETTFHF